MVKAQLGIVAPSDLKEGYQLDAEANGKAFIATVPKGGVKKGETFIVPFPENVEEYSDISSPSGFKHGLCSCCSACPQCWMGMCCMGILMGQIFQRLKLNFAGQPSQNNHNNTCLIVSCICLIGNTIAGFSSSFEINYDPDTETYNVKQNPTAIYGLNALISVYVLISLTLARNYMRKKFNIRGSCCGNTCLDDCCCAFWCNCLTLIQMSREAHDEDKFPYEVLSKTGLPNDVTIV